MIHDNKTIEIINVSLWQFVLLLFSPNRVRTLFTELFSSQIKVKNPNIGRAASKWCKTVANDFGTSDFSTWLSPRFDLSEETIVNLLLNQQKPVESHFQSGIVAFVRLKLSKPILN